MRCAGLLGYVALLIAIPAVAVAEIADIKLVLAVDVSISVDGSELDLQR